MFLPKKGTNHLEDVQQYANSTAWNSTKERVNSPKKNAISVA
jgi:hypothetical protein